MAKNDAKEQTLDVLLALGGVNWGLSLFDFNIVQVVDTAIGGTGIPQIIVYGGAGIAGLLKLLKMFGVMK